MNVKSLGQTKQGDYNVRIIGRQNLPDEFNRLSEKDQDRVLRFIRDEMAAVYNEARVYHCYPVINGTELAIDDDEEKCEGEITFSHYDCRYGDMSKFSCPDWKGTDESGLILHAMNHLGMLDKPFTGWGE